MLPYSERFLGLMFLAGATCLAPLAQAQDPSGKRPASSERLQAAWNDLTTADDAVVSRALLTFARFPDQVVPFLSNHLRPVKVDAERVTRWIADLEDKKFPVREKAAQELEYLGKFAKSHLEKGLAAKPEAETQRRLKELLAKIARSEEKPRPVPPLPRPGQPVRVTTINSKVYINGVALERYLVVPVVPVPSPLWVRATRAVAILEHVGSPAAVRLLEELAGGEAEAQPTLEARAALQRLKSQ